MSELGKPFLKKNQIKFKKKTENQGQNAACEQKTTSEKRKFGSNKKLGIELTMNGSGKPFTKKIRSKKTETLKIKVKLPHVNIKPLARKRILCTIFSLYFIIRATKCSRRKNTRFFAPLPVSA